MKPVLTRFFLCMLLVSSPIRQTLADDLSTGPASSSSGYVSVLPVPEITVSAGRPGVAKLQFSVKSGYHINSNQPHSDLQIPTKLRLDPPTDIGIGKVTYPDGTELSLSFSPNQTFSVYTGEFSIAARVSAVRSATPGNYRVHGVLDYQACSDRACFPPKQLPVSFDVKVLRSRIRSDKPRVRNPPQSPHIHN
jgi:hypothetical protein